MAGAPLRSRRRSGVSRPSEKPPDEPVFCTDEALGGNVVVNALRAVGLEVERLTDHHAPGTKDAVWLPDIGKRGWVLLTKDKRMRFRYAEILAIVNHGVRAFVLTGGNMKATDMAQSFLAAMPKMKRILAKTRTPFVASVTRAGDVTIVYPDR